MANKIILFYTYLLLYTHTCISRHRETVKPPLSLFPPFNPRKRGREEKEKEGGKRHGQTACENRSISASIPQTSSNIDEAANAPRTHLSPLLPSPVFHARLTLSLSVPPFFLPFVLPSFRAYGNSAPPPLSSRAQTRWRCNQPTGGGGGGRLRSVEKRNKYIYSRRNYHRSSD